MFDSDNVFLNQYTGSIQAGATQTCLIRIDCLTGKTLMASVVSDLAVTARLYGSADAFTDLESTGLDLSPYNGTRQTFEVRIVAASVSRRTKNFDLFLVG